MDPDGITTYTAPPAIYDPARTEPYSPAEVCEIARAARRDGHADAAYYIRGCDGTMQGWPGTIALGERSDALYPAPFVERPCVVKLPVDAEDEEGGDGYYSHFRVVDGVVEWGGNGHWRPFWPQCHKHGYIPCAALLAGLAELHANPTERVSAEVGG